MASTRDVEIHEFRPDELPMSCTFICVAPPGSGKTNLMMHLSHVLSARYPVARITCGTDGGYEDFKKVFPPLFVSNYYSEEDETRHVQRQRQCDLENGKGHPSNYAINILDDIGDDPKVYKSKIVRGLFKLGSQHWHQLMMMGIQYAIDLPPDVRKSVSYVAIFREPEIEERKKIYKVFGGICGTFQNFCDLMDQLTGDFTCMILKKRTQSNDLENVVFYYRAPDMSRVKWKFGCKEMWDWDKTRRNPDYVEEVIM